MQRVLVDWLRVAEVWVGANFLFGHDRTGNFSMLRVLGARYGFKAEKIDAVRYKDFVVSSTRIRRLVGEGRVDEAGALLGHQYFVDGTWSHGAMRGPDDRISDRQPRPRDNELLPPHGVYATTLTHRRHRAAIGHQYRRPADGRRVRPHVGRDARLRLRPRSVWHQRPRRRSCSGCGTSDASSRSTR